MQAFGSLEQSASFSTRFSTQTSENFFFCFWNIDKQASKLRLCEAPDGIGSDGIRSAAPALHCITNWLQHVHHHRSESSTADSRTFHSSRTVDLIGHLLAEASVQLVSIRWVNVKVVVTCFNSHQSNLQSINCCPIPALP